MDIGFYFSIVLLVVEHAKPDALQKAIPTLQKIYDLLKTVPGITP